MQKPISCSCVTVGLAVVSAGIVTVAPVTVSPVAPAVSPAVALTTAYDEMSLDGLIDHVRLGTLTVGGLLDGLGIGEEGLGDLLKLLTNISTLGQLLDFLGLGDLGLSPYSLTALLGLDTDAYLNFYYALDLNLEFDNFRLVDLLSAFGINPENVLGLGPLLVGLGDLLDGLNIDNAASSMLGTLGGALVSAGNLTLGSILEDLGADDSVGALTLNDLTGGLGGVLIGGPLGLEITGLLNGVDLGDVVGFLGLDDLSLNLGDFVGDWVNPYLADLLEGLVQGLG